MTNLVFLVLLGLILYPAWAHSVQPIKLNQLTATPAKKTGKDYSIDLNLYSYNFVRSQTKFFQSGEKPSSHQALSIGLRGRGRWLKGRWSFYGLGRRSFAEKKDYLHIPQAYIAWKNWALGRKNLDWFKNHHLSAQGLWQPRISWNKLAFEEEGLLAAHYQKKKGPWRWGGALMPVFFPEATAKFDVIDGQVVSDNIWFRPPPSSIELAGVSTPTYYNFDEPKAEKIIRNPGFAAFSAYEKPSYAFRFGYAFKPINQLLIGAPVALGLTEEGENNVHIDIKPRILYHHLSTIEVQIKNQGFGLEYTNTIEEPIRDDPPSEWLTQEIGPAVINELRLAYSWAKQGLQVFTHIFVRQGGERPDQGEFASEQSFFESRFIYSKAMALGLEVTKPSWALGPELKSQLSYDVDQKGVIFTNRLQLKLRRRLSAVVGADWIGYLQDEPEDVKEGFIGDYRANDQVYGGVHYVF